MAINPANTKKRIRSEVPCYKKAYTVYQYDRNKYSKIYKKIQNLSFTYGRHIFDKTNPYKVLQQCYIRDKFGKLKPLGDEKHIFRYKTLQNIFKEIADYLFIAYELENNIDVIRYLFKRTHIVMYCPDAQAEILETYNMPLKMRLKTHITLLRYLQQGLEIEEAVNLTRKKHNIKFLNATDEVSN